MEPTDLLNKYLAERHVMQLATTSGEGSWICTVYFVADGAGNLYWASLPSRRHSQDIAANPRVAAAIVVKAEIGQAVIGVQLEGQAEVLKSPSQAIAQAYADRFDRDTAWVEDMISGRTEHRMYKLTPSATYLFDEANFPGGQRQPV